MMARAKWMLVAVAAANLMLVAVFPPYDYVPLERRNLPAFDGFHPVFAVPPNRILNGDFLTLEIIVVVINFLIGWLILGNSARLPTRRANRAQRAVLWLVAVNLVFALVFPPFENIHAIGRAILPSFDAFYFILGDHSHRQIVTSILYIEVSLILANGLIFWVLLGSSRSRALTADEIRDAALHIRDARKKQS